MLSVLEQILKLLHPVAPFVTEEIWSVMPGERATIMKESYPEENGKWQDPDAEGSMELLMGVISSIRTIRSETDLHPTAKIEATLLCSDQQKRDFIGEYSDAIQSMTRAEKLHVLETGTVPDDAGHTLFEDIEVFVPLKGLIDAAEEIAKLGKERAKLEKEMKQIQGKLSNENFLSKAPPVVVEKEKQKEEELQVRLDKNAESAARLQKLL